MAWIVIDDTASRRHKRAQCGLCGRVKVVHTSTIARADGCKECVGVRRRTGSNRHFYNRVRDNARRRGITFRLTLDQFESLYAAQGGRCALTGVPIFFPTHKTAPLRDTTASLDRKDSRKGYTLDNVQWVHKVINMMKGTLTDEQLVSWAALLLSPMQPSADDGNQQPV